MNPAITLLTDFGTADHFVGVMKGVIFSINPGAAVIDITHEIPPHDIRAGAFTLLAAYRYFPSGTVHVAVVDPGVGSSRRPLIVTAGEHLFVGPDNGLFSYICEHEKNARAFHVVESRYFRQPVSNTFHGRDIFSPVAANLSKGEHPASFGPEVADYVKLEPLAPTKFPDGTIEGVILHIDRFGNCITNLTQAVLSEKMIAKGARLSVRGQEIDSFRTHFAEEGASRDALFVLWGSSGFLEIAAYQKSAAGILGARSGQPVRVKLGGIK